MIIEFNIGIDREAARAYKREGGKGRPLQFEKDNNCCEDNCVMFMRS